jgi:CheY-like chemotaxis protein
MKRVLIVEDDADLRRVYRTALQFGGFEVLESADGIHALHLVEQRPPDLVVLDLMLPTISGQIVQQEMASKPHTRDIPIVVVTGTSENLDDLDVPCILRKPITPERLVNAVRSCIVSGTAGHDYH